MTQIGDRIELINMIDDPDPIPSGSQGTVDFVLPQGKWTQVGVRWDNGRSLMLCTPPDSYRTIKTTPENE